MSVQKRTFARNSDSTTRGQCSLVSTFRLYRKERSILCTSELMFVLSILTPFRIINEFQTV